MNARNLIDYAANDNAVDFRQAMYAAIHDKVSAHIDAKKQEIAQGLVTQSESASDWEAEKEHKPSKSSDADKKHVEKYKAGMTKTNDKITSHSKKFSDKHDKEAKSGKWVAEEVEELDEEAGQFRLVSKHGAGKHTAKVYKDREWGEYRVRHYKDGAHMGEDSDSHHDDLKDAQGSAEHAVKHMDKHYQ